MCFISPGGGLQIFSGMFSTQWLNRSKRVPRGILISNRDIIWKYLSLINPSVCVAQDGSNMFIYLDRYYQTYLSVTHTCSQPKTLCSWPGLTRGSSLCRTKSYSRRSSTPSMVPSGSNTLPNDCFSSHSSWRFYTYRNTTGEYYESYLFSNRRH